MPQLHAQNKISVFFESNKHKTHDKGLQELKEFIHNNFDYIDSITFIAYTDTVGSEEKNKKLAQKRLEFVESNIDNNLTYKAKRLVRGESKRHKFERNRRVDLIIYSSLKEQIEPDSSIPDRNFCHKIDYQLLSNCSFKKVKIGTREFMQIETEFFNNHGRNIYYFIVNPEDSLKKIAPVVWKNKSTGEDWWKKKRQVALIPTESFEHSKIFKLENGPCNSCHCNSDHPKKDSIMVRAEMINHNFQHKQTIFNKNTIKIRIPSQFVDPNTVYYYNNFQKVEWKKSKNDSYYYYKIKNYDHDLSSLNFNYFVEYCSLPKSNKRAYCGNKMSHWMCGTVLFKGNPINLKIENGYHYKTQFHSTYVAIQPYDLKFYKEKLEIHAFLGLIYNNKLNYYVSQRFKYRLLKMELHPLKEYSDWQSKKSKLNTYKNLQLFIGTDWMNYAEKEGKSILNYSYFELRYQNENLIFFNSLFVRYGIAQTYLKKTHDIQNMFQLGLLHDLYL
jgi:hypothetical protein